MSRLETQLYKQKLEDLSLPQLSLSNKHSQKSNSRYDSLPNEYEEEEEKIQLFGDEEDLVYDKPA